MKTINQITEQTHFIGIIVPEFLADLLQQCRVWMQNQYGCRSGYGTPIHITLIPPFHLPDTYTDSDVKKAIHAAIKETEQLHILPFTAKVDGFGSFSDRTIFAFIEADKSWNMLYDIVLNNFRQILPGVIRHDTRSFTPHLTVANRDIPHEVIPAALDHFAQMHIRTDIPVNTIGIFKRSARGGWIPDEYFSTESASLMHE